MDTILLPMLDDLRACLAGRLMDTLGGWREGCPVSVVPGQDAVADWCTCGSRGSTPGQGCGMAWVRLADAFPTSEAFPTPDRQARQTAVGVVSAVIEAGVFRCVPTGSSGPRGVNPPTVAQQTQAGLVAADDALAVHAAILCCEPITGRPHVLGRYVPRSSGDCGGGFWTVTVQLNRRAKTSAP